MGNASISKKTGRIVKGERPAGRGKIDTREKDKEKEEEEEEEEEEEISVAELLKPQDPSIVGKVSEQKVLICFYWPLLTANSAQRKAVFSYALRCLNCPVNYDAKMLLAYTEDNYSSLARILNLQGVDLRSEIRTARRTGKVGP